MPSTTTVHTLASRLQHVADVALRRRESRRLYRFFLGFLECESFADLRALAQGCAFEAFVDLGGTSEQWADFDWETHQERLTTETSRRLVYLLQNGSSSYSDWAMRRRVRRLPATDQLWGAWKPLFTPCLPSAATEHAEEATELEQELAKLLPALKEVLTPYEYGIMKRRYIDGISGPALAREMVATDVSLRGRANAYKLAESRIWKTVERAKTRARAHLSQHWATLAKEVG